MALRDPVADGQIDPLILDGQGIGPQKVTDNLPDFGPSLMAPGVPGEEEAGEAGLLGRLRQPEAEIPEEVRVFQQLRAVGADIVPVELQAVPGQRFAGVQMAFDGPDAVGAVIGEVLAARPVQPFLPQNAGGVVPPLRVRRLRNAQGAVLIEILAALRRELKPHRVPRRPPVGAGDQLAVVPHLVVRQLSAGKAGKAAPVGRAVQVAVLGVFAAAVVKGHAGEGAATVFGIYIDIVLRGLQLRQGDPYALRHPSRISLKSGHRLGRRMSRTMGSCFSRNTLSRASMPYFSLYSISSL